MTFQPETQDEIYTRIRDAIAAASAITNFSPNSPEKAISDDGFSAEMRERQHEQLAVQLSARIDWAGKTITEDDLEDILSDPSKVDVELLNEFMDEEDLDELAKRNGVTRDPGAFSTGQVTFTTTDDSVTVPGGTTVGTEPDATGDFLSYTTDEDVSPSSGETTVKASITAEERGNDHNVGPDSITYLPSPPSGVSSVTNNNSTSGGEDEETTEELRDRAKKVLINNSGGGTVGGIRGGLVSTFDGLVLSDVLVEEFFDPDTANGDRQDSPYIDVVVDGGGTDTEVEQELDVLKPAAIKPYLVRPKDIVVDVSVQVSGNDIDTNDIKDAVRDYITGRGIGQDLIRDKMTFTILDAEDNVDNIESMTITIIDETHVYDSDNSGGNAPNHPLYHLNKGDSMAPDGHTNGDGIVEVTGTLSGSDNTFTEGTDYDEGDVGSDGTTDAIDWGLSGDNPDEDTEFYVDYDIREDLPVGNREKSTPGTVSVTVV